MYLNQIGTYWDSRAEGYSMTIHQQLKSNEYSYFRDMLRRGAPQGEGLSCLDIGCGPGFFSILLAQDGHNVTAVDYSEGMLEKATENFSEMGVDIMTAQGDAQNLPFASGSFDYIVSRNLVWNLEYPENAYREWIRLLKPGGRLLVADGNHYLHYYDEVYLASKVGGENHHPDIYGVDPSPINNIARDLPLSREHRPEWDMQTLLRLGMEHLDVHVSRREFPDPADGETKSVIADFVVCAGKPANKKILSGEEQQKLIDDQWTEASDNYDNIIHDELNSFRVKAWTDLILENAPKKPVLDILDCGCGPAFFSILLSRAGHRVVGLDGSEGMLNHATQNALQYDVHPLFVRGDCHDLPFPDNSFDLVVSRNVTHTLRNHRQVYGQWLRVLRPGGKLLIFDANWHLMQTDPDIRREFSRREKECIERYGSNFSGGKREVDDCEVTSSHLLGTCVRPGWDMSILEQAGYKNIFTEENIIDGLWDDKEKLIYGSTPMFMIAASK
ncbi:MAG: class I SAM-dependent methyltransferase [Clostridiales bacterium]|nr:class I SAM-dependent methyltransferase [Clostridiales bacterium]